MELLVPFTTMLAPAPASRLLPLPIKMAPDRTAVVLASVLALLLPLTVRPEPIPRVVVLPLPFTCADERSPAFVVLDVPFTYRAVEASALAVFDLPSMTTVEWSPMVV